MKQNKLNILFSCIGRRVSLLQSFKKAAAQLKRKNSSRQFGFYGTEITELSSALQLCDKSFLVNPVTHRDYIKELLKIVKDHKIDLLVPTVDLDLRLLADNKSKFSKLGCVVLVSPPDVIEICQDKRQTYHFLKNNGFGTPITLTSRAAIKSSSLNWPCFLKPWDGYAGRGTAIVRNLKELSFYSKHIPNCIVQEYIAGSEYTCDVYVDFDMKVRSVVPRKRIEIRTGEVSKAQTIKDSRIMETAAKVVETLGAGPGVITIQLILKDDDQIKFIEINPRFGGGAPLSIKAGADFPKWLMQEVLGQKPRIKFDGFKDNLVMLRYDSEVWLQK